MNTAVQTKYLGSDHNEPVDHRRNEHHINLVAPAQLSDRIVAQAYRPEIVEAISDLKTRSKCVPLSALASTRIRQGVTPRYGGDGPICLKLKDVRHLLVDSSTTNRVTLEFAKQNTDSLIKGDAVLINRSGGFTVGRAGAYLRSQSVFVSDDVFFFVPNDKCDAAFIAAFLNSWWGKRALESGINGSTGQLKLSRDHIAHLPVPSFPLELQKAVGNKIRRADRLFELAVASEKEMRSSLADACGRPNDFRSPSMTFFVAKNRLSSHRLNPTEYEPKLLAVEDQIATALDGMSLQMAMVTKRDLSNGATPKGAKYQKEGVGFLRVQNIRPNRLDLSDLVFIDSAADQQLKRSQIRENDIVLTITGYPGTACCVRAVDLPLNINQHSVRFQLSEDWNPFFVAAFLNSEWGEAQVKRRAIGGTRDALDYPSVRSILIPRISKEVQNKIGSHAEAYSTYLGEAPKLLHSALRDVESLILGNADKDKLMENALEESQWLLNNPAPQTKEDDVK